MSRAASPVALAPGSRLWLEGDSPLHKWRTETRRLDVTAALAPGAPTALEAAARGGGVAGARRPVPVASLESGEGGLDDTLRKALDAKHHPDVVFVVDRVELGPRGQEGFSARLVGKLTLAGTTRPVTVDALAVPTSGGLELKGSQPLLMSDYGVKPPVLMLGLLKTADHVFVGFDLTLASG